MKHEHQYRGRIWFQNKVLDNFETGDYFLAIAKISRLLEEEYSNVRGDILDLNSGEVVYRGRYSQVN
jgi:hypothetical protein